MKYISFILLITCLFPEIFLTTGCKKEIKKDIIIPVVTTTPVSNITEYAATSGGNITDAGGAAIIEKGVCWSSGPTPTITDSKTTEGRGTGSFTSNIPSLSPTTKYYVSAYATNSAGTGYGSAISFTTAGPLTDIDGNVYHSVSIGTQLWMVENLKVTHYRNGDLIPNITDDVQWSGLTTGAYCDYDNLIINSTTYGKLYNWYAVLDSRNLAPAGWHVPTDEEWTTLVTYLGGEDIAASKLKETGTTHWNSPNTGATNDMGFTGLPGGSRGFSSFSGMRYNGNYWSASESDATSAWSWDMDYRSTSIYRNLIPCKFGYSIRCLKD
jgi:uncharacterized protein (TIGR02145 family)